LRQTRPLGPKFSNFHWPPPTENRKTTSLVKLGADVLDFTWSPATQNQKDPRLANPIYKKVAPLSSTMGAVAKIEVAAGAKKIASPLL